MDEVQVQGIERARRVRAARELGGIKTPAALEQAMAEAGYGSGYDYSTIRKWEDEDHTQTLYRKQLAPLAEVCNVRLEFFVMELRPTRLAQVPGHPELPDALKQRPATRRRDDERPGRKQNPGAEGGSSNSDE